MCLAQKQEVRCFLTWIQFLVQAQIRCVILSRFHGPCKPVSSYKVGNIIITSTACSCRGVKCCCTCRVLSMEPLIQGSVCLNRKRTQKDTTDQQHGPVLWINCLWGRFKIPRFGESHNVEVKEGP